jgi:hypothetical protein
MNGRIAHPRIWDNPTLRMPIVASAKNRRGIIRIILSKNDPEVGCAKS